MCWSCWLIMVNLPFVQLVPWLTTLAWARLRLWRFLLGTRNCDLVKIKRYYLTLVLTLVKRYLCRMLVVKLGDKFYKSMCNHLVGKEFDIIDIMG